MVSVVGWLDKGEVSLFVGRFVFCRVGGRFNTKGETIHRSSVSLEMFFRSSRNFFQSGVMFQ